MNNAIIYVFCGRLYSVNSLTVALMLMDLYQGGQIDGSE